MNEGIAKALRRQARAEGYKTAVEGRGTVLPGKETKALWRSLNHRQRGQWRKQLPQTRAQRRKEVRDAFERAAPAIRAKLLALPNVTAAHVFMNRPNAGGVPPHSIEVLVEGGDDRGTAR